MSQDAGDSPRPRKRPSSRPVPPPTTEIDPFADNESMDASTFHPTAPGVPERAPVGGSGGAKRKKPRVEVGGPNLFERLVFGKISAGHLATFCRQAAAYLEAGVDVSKAFGSLQQQFASTALGPVIVRLQLAVRRGDALAEAMAREPQAFDEQFLAMMKVAEARGGVPETLRSLSRHYEARQRLIRQARAALIYPTAVVLVSLIVGWLLTAFVLPKIVDLLRDITRGGNADLPGPTRLLIAISDFMRWIGWWAVPLGAIGAFWLLTRFYRTPAGKTLLDEIALKIPVFGNLLRMLDMTRFSRTLSTLLQAGVDYGTSLDLTADVVRMAPYRRLLRGIRGEILEGNDLSTALAATHRFPSDVIAYVETGESTGQLPESLDKLANEYEERVEYTVKNLGSLVQPLIIIVLGGIVLFIVVAMVMAYVSALGQLAGGL